MTTADFMVIAHRGASAYTPENTVAAFDLALRLGCHHIELDVDLTSDGHIVVMHDDTVDRTTNGIGPVGSHTLAELRALDAGGGLGGPARTLAAEFGCTVTVLDLTEAFCRTGALLTAWTHLSHRVTFCQGSALALPFPDHSFDVVWAQNSFMNIADKEGLYASISRVLRAGGRLAFQEVMAGPVQPPHFPVHWADSPALSFLHPPAEMRALVPRLGFVEVAWADTTPAALEAQRQRAATASLLGPAAQTLPHLSFILRPRAAAEQVARNGARNLEEGRVAYIQGVFDRR